MEVRLGKWGFFVGGRNIIIMRSDGRGGEEDQTGSIRLGLYHGREKISFLEKEREGVEELVSE